MSITHPSFGTLDDNRIIIFDTTLRDGEQSPGFSMNLNEKIRMAETLTELGVDVIEAGFAIASPGDFESVKTISETIGQRANTPVIASLARAGQMDVMSAADALRPAKRKRIHIVIATSDLHMKYKLRLTPEEVIQATIDSVTLARQHADDVEWSAEDATRSDPDFLARVVEAAIEAGATTINLPDTVGYALPEDMERMYADIRNRVPGVEKVILSTHNHNDLGLAVANTIASFRAGARQVECTINGIGERAGNASLEEIVMAVRTRNDAIPFVNRIVTEHLLRSSKLLSTITGFDVQPNKAIVGRNAFAHEAGIHQDGVLKNAATYEIMTPESVGWQKSSLVLGKHSGRAAFRDKLSTLGYSIGDNQLNDAFRRFKDLADRKKVVFDDDIVALVDDEVMRDHERIRFVSLDLHAGSKGPARAELELMVDGVVKQSMSSGDGPVDAVFKAIREVFPHEANLVLFSVGAVTEGTDAQAKTTVRLEEAGKMVDGQGADTDTIVSAARAYVHALNKLMVKRVRTEPQALSA
ncbi:MAG TPA: 2-isopropylmalate synthase [Acetobacteraceae bacterium]|jgi:2-isopropylmalate synthase|nr:2-isopropylmalate synthase [Acetobacteraceae bacterium]